MIYTDGVHIISSKGRKDLEKFAQVSGINKCWLHRGRKIHYDLPKKFPLEHIIRLGAQLVTTRELVKILRGTR